MMIVAVLGGWALLKVFEFKDEQEYRAKHGVTYSQFLNIYKGMPEKEVRRIFGSYGTSIASYSVGYHQFYKYAWDGNSPNSRVLITFKDDEVYDTMEVGL